MVQAGKGGGRLDGAMGTFLLHDYKINSLGNYIGVLGLTLID